MNNLIYKYIKIDTNEVVYVGRTNNLARRREEHEQYEPFEQQRPHYNYPLSRGIRKYGLKNYKCEIIEDNLTYEQSLEREKYWIKYYNTYNDPSKYNQTPGGEYITEPLYSDDVIDRVKWLLEHQVPYKEIQEETGISFPHISEINTGKRRRDNIHNYPINEKTCGKKLDQEEVLEIIELLKQSNLSNKEIGLQYNIGEGTIEKINKGKGYKQDNIEYPIRSRIKQTKSHHLKKDELDNLINDIINTEIPFSQLATKYKIGTSTVYNINNGVTRRQDKYTYPLRIRKD